MNEESFYFLDGECEEENEYLYYGDEYNDCSTIEMTLEGKARHEIFRSQTSALASEVKDSTGLRN